jgi:hypothetical protein
LRKKEITLLAQEGKMSTIEIVLKDDSKLTEIMSILENIANLSSEIFEIKVKTEAKNEVEALMKLSEKSIAEIYENDDIEYNVNDLKVQYS